MKREDYNRTLDLANYVDLQEVSVRILKEWIKTKLITENGTKIEPTQPALGRLSRRQVVRGDVLNGFIVYSTHRIQQEGDYPDLMYNFTEEQRIAYTGRLLMLESGFSKEINVLSLEAWKIYNGAQYN